MGFFSDFIERPLGSATPGIWTNTIGEALGGLTHYGSSIGYSLSDLFLDDLTEFMSGLNLETALSDFAGSLGEIGGDIVEGIGDAGSGFIDMGGDIVEAVGDAGGDIVEAAGDGLETLGENIDSGIETLGDNVSSGIDTFTENLESGIETLGDNIGSGVDTLGDNVGSFLEDTADSVGQFAEDPWGYTEQNVDSGIGTIAHGIGQGVGGVVQEFGDWVQNVGGVVEDVGSGLDIGVIEELGQWIDDKAGSEIEDFGKTNLPEIIEGAVGTIGSILTPTGWDDIDDYADQFIQGFDQLIAGDEWRRDYGQARYNVADAAPMLSPDAAKEMAMEQWLYDQGYRSRPEGMNSGTSMNYYQWMQDKGRDYFNQYKPVYGEEVDSDGNPVQIGQELTGNTWDDLYSAFNSQYQPTTAQLGGLNALQGYDQFGGIQSAEWDPSGYYKLNLADGGTKYFLPGQAISGYDIQLADIPYDSDYYQATPPSELKNLGAAFFDIDPTSFYDANKMVDLRDDLFGGPGQINLGGSLYDVNAPTGADFSRGFILDDPLSSGLQLGQMNFTAHGQEDNGIGQPLGAAIGAVLGGPVGASLGAMVGTVGQAAGTPDVDWGQVAENLAIQGALTYGGMYGSDMFAQGGSAYNALSAAGYSDAAIKAIGAGAVGAGMGATSSIINPNDPNSVGEGALIGGLGSLTAQQVAGTLGIDGNMGKWLSAGVNNAAQRYFQDKLNPQVPYDPRQDLANAQDQGKLLSEEFNSYLTGGNSSPYQYNNYVDLDRLGWLNRGWARGLDTTSTNNPFTNLIGQYNAAGAGGYDLGGFDAQSMYGQAADTWNRDYANLMKIQAGRQNSNMAMGNFNSNAMNINQMGLGDFGGMNDFKGISGFGGMG